MAPGAEPALFLLYLSSSVAWSKSTLVPLLPLLLHAHALSLYLLYLPLTGLFLGAHLDLLYRTLY